MGILSKYLTIRSTMHFLISFKTQKSFGKGPEQFAPVPRYSTISLRTNIPIKDLLRYFTRTNYITRTNIPIKDLLRYFK
jgi:hypothetical protein